MPVVLYTSDEESSAGNIYDDKTGISYEYPLRYRKLIFPGEPFVYHIGKKGYTGAGIIGDVHESVNPGLLVCEILDYKPFDENVPLKGPDGYYYEADPAAGKINIYWSQGVRPVSVGAYEQIVWSTSEKTPAQNLGVSGYASPEVANLVESISVKHAAAWLKANFPNYTLTIMPHNNPGYDIRLGSAADPFRFVEVKGTQSSAPVFWLSEGERKFSVSNAEKYLFLVVSGIDLKAASEPILTIRSGALSGEDVELEASQWRGQILVEKGVV